MFQDEVDGKLDGKLDTRYMQGVLIFMQEKPGDAWFALTRIRRENNLDKIAAKMGLK